MTQCRMPDRRWRLLTDAALSAKWQQKTAQLIAREIKSMNTVPDGLLTTLEQKISPENAALIVIDVQNDFVANNGFFDGVGADVGSIQQHTIPRLLKLIEAARAAGVLVVFVQAIYDPQDLSEPMLERNVRTGRDKPRC